MITNIKDKFRNTFKDISTNYNFLRASIGLFTFAVLVFILIAGDLPSAKKIEVGKPAPWDVKASTSVQIIDEQQWHKAKLLAAEQVATVENFEPYAERISDNKISVTFECIKDLIKLKSSHKATKEQLQEVKDKIPIDLSGKTLDILLNADLPRLEQYHNTARHLLGIVMREGVQDSQLDEARDRVKKEAESFPGLSDEHRQVAMEIASKALIANKYPNLEATKRAKEAAMSQVEPSMRIIMPGQVVVREGDIVGENDLPALEALGYYKPHLTLSGLVSFSVLITVMVILVSFYIKIHLIHIYNNPGLLLSLALLSIAFAGLSRYLTTISVYLAPIPIPAMMISMLIDTRLAILATSILSLYVGIETGSLPAVAVCMFTGIVSILAVTKINKRWDMVTASLLVWGSNVISVMIFSLLSVQGIDEILRDTLLFGGMNGLLSAIIASGSIPFLESVFNVTTHARMLELTNPTEPVLHELITKAPGTYQHSIMVANLSESAAAAVGADSLLCRAGAYYHDIGKMKQPIMFVENQLGQENPHDKLPPALSAMIVISHVSLGLELAKQYKVPDVITKFISEHHGNNLASFFYQKAKAQTDEPVFEEDFRYPGPRPQSKETAIVMICDSLEAASRTLTMPTKENIQKLVDKIVKNIIDNQQLSECDLSFKDINTVKASIVRNLTSHYHSRVVYPDAAALAGGKKKAQPTPAPEPTLAPTQPPEAQSAATEKNNEDSAVPTPAAPQNKTKE